MIGHGGAAARDLWSATGQHAGPLWIDEPSLDLVIADIVVSDEHADRKGTMRVASRKLSRSDGIERARDAELARNSARKKLDTPR